MTNLELRDALADTVGRIPHLTGLYFRLLPNEPEVQALCSEPVSLHLLYVVPGMDAVYGERGSEKEREAMAIEDKQETAFTTRTGYSLTVIDSVKCVTAGARFRKGMIFEKVPLHQESSDA